MTTQQTASASAINFRGAEPFQFLGQPTQLRASAESTNGAFGLLEHWSMPPGFSSPYHTHTNEDEAFYVLEGEVAFICDGKWMRGGAGAYVFGPRGIPHGFQIIGNTPARMLLLASPGGFEQFVLELSVPIDTPPAPPDMAKLGATAAKFGIDVHGPLPELPADFAQPAATDLKALNQSWIDAFNNRDWAAEASFRAPNFHATLSGSPQPLDNVAWSGFLQGFAASFPDSRIEVHSIIAEGNISVTHWTITGTHRDAFQGIPAAGRAVRFTGVEHNRFENGKLVDHLSQFDLVGLLHQLGATPA
jgi:steroid delta-isomerase-like uncharacterized protein